ncbi:hypothetical protein MA16_Dca010761 [Dendrobium catenatum]|uniref:Uncharacterized protein n=1 Tax=Dendrobium catenatum TaxID=906689 RepID=A0A2I0VKF2_9ASPA|nr:hypothetical protein MA16_Dca010761 [Dendrobium catenatum]
MAQPLQYEWAMLPQTLDKCNSVRSADKMLKYHWTNSRYHCPFLEFGADGRQGHREHSLIILSLVPASCRPWDYFFCLLASTFLAQKCFKGLDGGGKNKIQDQQE